jgi:tight adherence protein B
MTASVVALYAVTVAAIFAFLCGFLSTFSRDIVAERTTRRLDEMGPKVAPLRRRRSRVRLGLLQWCANLVATSGAALSAEYIALLMVLGTLGVSTILAMIGLHPLAAFGGGLLAGCALPVWLLCQMRRRRLRRIVADLPDAIDILVRSLKVGHPIPMGIHMVADAMRDPIRREFRLVYDTMSLGLDLRDALEKMSERLGIPELRYMVAAIRIQHTTGGNLSEILASLANVMRERDHLHMKVRALSAEARLSGKIMAALPIVVFAGVNYFNPRYYAAAVTNQTLQMVLLGAGLLMVLGMLCVRRIVNFRV